MCTQLRGEGEGAAHTPVLHECAATLIKTPIGWFVCVYIYIHIQGVQIVVVVNKNLGRVCARHVYNKILLPSLIKYTLSTVHHSHVMTTIFTLNNHVFFSPNQKNIKKKQTSLQKIQHQHLHMRQAPGVARYKYRAKIGEYTGDMLMH